MTEPLFPSQVSPDVTFFDRFASAASRLASRSPFFAFCVALIVVWAPTMFVMDINSSQLIINTTTTIVTFLMVAIIQNSETRSDLALQHKLNAIAKVLADNLEADGYIGDAEELREAIGLELRESTSRKNAR